MRKRTGTRLPLRHLRRSIPACVRKWKQGWDTLASRSEGLSYLPNKGSHVSSRVPRAWTRNLSWLKKFCSLWSATYTTHLCHIQTKSMREGDLVLIVFPLSYNAIWQKKLVSLNLVSSDRIHNVQCAITNFFSPCLYPASHVLTLHLKELDSFLKSW